VAQAEWLGLKVGGCLTLMLHSSDEPGELLQWQCHDDCTITIVVQYLYYYYRLMLITDILNVVIW